MAASSLEQADRLMAAGRPAEAVAVLRQASGLGDADALFQLALWHLIGDPVPRDLDKARALLAEATEIGHEDAAMTEVALVGNGSGGTRDWSGALVRLRAAAARFGGVAQQQLGLMERMALDAQGDPRRLPQPEVLSSAPSIRHWRGVLTPDECAHIAMSVQDILEPSVVADPRTGRAMAHPIRRSSAAVIGPTRESLPIQAIQRRIAALTGTDVRQGEPFSVLHYAPGQEYRPHMDTLPNEANQRVMTVLLYLNAGYAGGETQFPEIGLTVPGGLGDMVAFTNVLPDGSPDPAMRHAGLPVQRGAKWMATRWIRARPFDVWNPGG